MWKGFVDTLVYETAGMEKGDRLADALAFFIYDSVKIAFLLVSIIFVITFFALLYECRKSARLFE